MTTRLRSVLTALLLLLSGSALTLVIQHFSAEDPAGSPAAMHNSILNHLDSALSLTPAQRDSIDLIFRRHQSRVDSSWRTINQRMSTTMDSVQSELEQILRPDQIAAFHQFMRLRHGAHQPRH
jgi:hypothetical protein